MVKIYNIHSNTISKEDLVDLKKIINKGEDLFLLNEDIRYEVIDFDKMTVMKSSNYTRNVYAVYIKICNICKYMIKKVKSIKITKSKK